MKRLEKLEKPAILLARSESWTLEYLSARRDRDLGNMRKKLPSRYTHPEIRDMLALETGHKCAYCESSIEQVGFPHVEHIRPKSKFPELVVEWVNLTVGCEICNKYKGDYYDEDEPLLNPYDDEPDRHLVFAGSMVRQRPGDELGERTVLRLKLFRAALTAAREERINSVAGAVDRWAAATGTRRELLEEAIREDAEKGQYTAAVTAYLLLQGFPLLNNAADPAHQ